MLLAVKATNLKIINLSHFANKLFIVTAIKAVCERCFLGDQGGRAISNVELNEKNQNAKTDVK